MSQNNVIWVMVDQMRGDAMSFMGDPNVRTPNLDAIANCGVHFENAYSGFPLCCPARGSFLTGRYPHQAVPGHQYPLDPGIPTIASYFKNSGYYTSWIGKWHLAGWQEKEGRAAKYIVPKKMRGGFDSWRGYENNNSQYDCWVHGHHQGEEVDLYRLPGFETDCLTDLLLEEIESNQNKPFFLSLSVQPPHDPYVAPEAYMRQYQAGKIILKDNVPPIASIRAKAQRELAGYYALIENVDWNVGRIMDKLRKLYLDKNTYIVFFSDHGDQHGSHGHFRKMTPYQEAIRIPFLIWGGTEIRYQTGGRRSFQMLNQVDVMPTTLGLAGVPIPEDLVGSDFSFFCHGISSPKEFPNEVYLQSVVPTGHAPSIDIPWRGIVTADGWKYVCMEHQPMFLFHLKEDPGELVNLAFHAHASVKRKELNEKLIGWVKRAGDSFSLPVF